MASDQIRQMVNFILQEAHEKANEIRVKVSFVIVLGGKGIPGSQTTKMNGPPLNSILPRKQKMRNNDTRGG
jgi:hypothetical protein